MIEGRQNLQTKAPSLRVIVPCSMTIQLCSRCVIPQAGAWASWWPRRLCWQFKHFMVPSHRGFHLTQRHCVFCYGLRKPTLTL